jgi:hypothetical protein
MDQLQRRPVVQLDREFRGDSNKNPPESPPATPPDKQKRLAELKEKVIGLIKAGRDAGYDLAADNLQYWYDGKGGERRIPAEHFSSEAFVLGWLRERPLSKFREGAMRRVAEGKVSFEMTWEDSVYAPGGSKLFYALGGFTILSKVTATAEKQSPADGGGWIVTLGAWTCSVKDDYNWDVGKTTYVPGFGDVRDEDLRLLEENGFGKSYKIQSEPWLVNDIYLSSFYFQSNGKDAGTNAP